MNAVDRPFTQGVSTVEESSRCSLRAHTLPANTVGIRQLVIKKQNGRVVAARSQLVDRMEDALVRWRPPASCHVGSTAVLRGKHPYQLAADVDADADADTMPLQTSLDSIRQCFENLTRPLTQQRPSSESLPGASSPHNSSHSSSASGMAQQIRQSVQSAGTRGTTPHAAAPYENDQENRHELDDCETERVSYSFPIPTYYLPYSDVRPVGESTRENNDDSRGGWSQWREFWEKFRREFRAMCSCT